MGRWQRYDQDGERGTEQEAVRQEVRHLQDLQSQMVAGEGVFSFRNAS